MSRTQLVWFATGAAATVVSAVVANFAFSAESHREPTLVLTDPMSSLEPPATSEPSEQFKSLGAKLAFDCGVKRFEMRGLAISETAPVTAILVDQENVVPINCVLKKIAGSEISLSISINEGK